MLILTLQQICYYMKHHFIQIILKFYQIAKQMAKYQYQRELLFSNKKESEIEEFLLKTDTLYFTEILDEKGNTALHHASFLDHLHIIQKYIQKAEELVRGRQAEKGLEKKIIDWVNTKNADGFTALHYGAYKGNIQIIKYLQSKGADYEKKTKSGLNVLHLAAQGNKVKTFIYFKERMSINSRDTKMSSPLHWAAYMGSEASVDFILSHPQRELNLKDAELQTPLHLATAYGNTRIVKKLLIAGADRLMKNKQKETALMIAQMNDYPSIRGMLTEEFTCKEKVKIYCKCKNQLKPKNRQPIRPFFFVLSFLIFVLSSLLLPVPSQVDIIYYYGVFGINLLTLVLYIILLPYPSSRKKVSDEVLLKNKVNVDLVCMFCMSVKPKRSFHCHICQICIKNYDHHCYWINNCVGSHNVRTFILFVLLFFLHLLWYCTLAFLTFLLPGETMYIIQELNFGLNGIIVNVIFGVQGAVCLFLLPFIASLLFIQLKNIYLNKSTYERFSNKKSTLQTDTSYLIKDKLSKNKNRGSCSNFCSLCCYCFQEKDKQEHKINESFRQSLMS